MMHIATARHTERQTALMQHLQHLEKGKIAVKEQSTYLKGRSSSFIACTSLHMSCRLLHNFSKILLKLSRIPKFFHSQLYKQPPIKLSLCILSFKTWMVLIFCSLPLNIPGRNFTADGEAGKSIARWSSSNLRRLTFSIYLHIQVFAL